jgi:hypothetical protein
MPFGPTNFARPSPNDLPHLCEAFWRKDPARTDGLHSGLGLTLVDANAKIRGGSMTINMPIRNTLCVSFGNSSHTRSSQFLFARNLIVAWFERRTGF